MPKQKIALACLGVEQKQLEQLVVSFKLFLLAYLLFFSLSAQSADLVKGEAVYTTTCKACHSTGVLNAPKPGDMEAWSPRLKQGMAVLVDHSLKGFNNMPAKGGNAALQKADLENAIAYMINPPAKKITPPQDPEEGVEKDKKFFRHLEKGKQWVIPLDKDGYYLPPPLTELPKDKYGEEVLLGHKIFTETKKYAPRYAGRGLNCSSCHLDAGKKPNALPLWGAAGMYPGYRFSSDKNDTMEDRIADCFRNSMNGIAPVPDAPEMRALLAYTNFVSKGIPIGVHVAGRSLPDVDYTGYEASPARGKELYGAKCASCHGTDGLGKKKPDGTYQYPPLWGMDSYNKGASLFKQRKLARFIKANMPLGQDFSLDDQQSYDLASFINIHERPKNPAKGLIQELMGDTSH